MRHYGVLDMKLLSEIGAIIVGVVSGIWLYAQPGFEPLIVFLLAMGTIVVQANKRFRSDDTSIFLNSALLPIKRWVYKQKAIASISFDTLSGPRAAHHEVRAYAIWDDVGPTMRVELRHKKSRGSWSTFDSFEGHHVQLEAKDIDDDRNPELLLRYACGAHTRVIKAFRVGISGLLELIPGSEVGSDWPEIEVEDRDGDGKDEIYAKQRDWKGEPSQQFLQEVHVYKEGRFVKAGDV